MSKVVPILSPTTNRPTLLRRQSSVDLPEKYYGFESLNEAISSDGEKLSAIALISSEYLVHLNTAGKRLPPRQEIERDNPSAIFNGVLNEDVRVIAMSYCWQTKEHPDPDMEILDSLCTFLRYLDESRWFGGEEVDSYKLKDRQVFVFWDYGSLYQKGAADEEALHEAQLDAFTRGLACSNLIYAHTATLSLLDSSDPFYFERAWPYFESLVSQLAYRHDSVIDLPTALESIDRRQQQHPGDHPSDEAMRSLKILYDDCMVSARKLPETPLFFSKNIEGRDVTNGGDKGKLKKLYEETFSDVVKHTRSFMLPTVPRTEGSYWTSFLRETIPQCSHLVQIDLSYNDQIEREALDVFRVAVQLETLKLSNCTGFFGTLAGLLPLLKLRELNLSGCVKLTGDVVALGPLKSLEIVNLESCSELVLNESGEPLGTFFEAENLRELNVHGTIFYEASLRCSDDQFAGYVQHGDRFKVGRCGESPVFSAAYFNQLKALRDLLGSIHDSSLRSQAANWTQRQPLHCTDSSKGESALIIASKKGFTDVVALLLSLGGADVSVKCDHGTALIVAAQHAHAEVCQRLIDAGSDSECEMTTEDGRTALHHAAAHGSDKVVNLLLSSNRFNINAGDSKNQTPLMWAAEKGHWPIIKLLRKFNAAIDMRNKNKETALNIAERFMKSDYAGSERWLDAKRWLEAPLKECASAIVRKSSMVGNEIIAAREHLDSSYKRWKHLAALWKRASIKPVALIPLSGRTEVRVDLLVRGMLRRRIPVILMPVEQIDAAASDVSAACALLWGLKDKDTASNKTKSNWDRLVKKASEKLCNKIIVVRDSGNNTNRPKLTLLNNPQDPYPESKKFQTVDFPILLDTGDDDYATGMAEDKAVVEGGGVLDAGNEVPEEVKERENAKRVKEAEEEKGRKDAEEKQRKDRLENIDSCIDKLAFILKVDCRLTRFDVVTLTEHSTDTEDCPTVIARQKSEHFETRLIHIEQSLQTLQRCADALQTLHIKKKADLGPIAARLLRWARYLQVQRCADALAALPSYNEKRFLGDWKPTASN